MENLQERVEQFNKLLVWHITKGIEELHFEVNQKLKIKKGDALVENPQIAVTPDVMELAIKRIIAVNQDRSVDTISNQDILDVLGGVLDYDVLLDGETGLEARTFKCNIGMGDAKQTSLVMKLEPEIRLGYEELINPFDYSEEKLIAWFDDFCTRIMALNNPKPKDIVLNPNKKYPFLTITGGLRPIKDVYFPPGTTRKIAQMLIKLAHNPAIDQIVAKNNGSLDTMDLDLAYKTSVGRRFRVNVADVFDWEEEHCPLITMRLLPDKPFTTEELKLPQAIRDMIFNIKMGMVIISGTTGSGKSTTMCAMIDFLLKSKSVNFLTIENPIETVFPSFNYPKSIITQREVGKHSTSQSKSMESAVRQTLNMAMVGEIRNGHDAMMAMELAQSGHLIFATLHAGSVGESVGRIVDMFPADQEKKVREMLAAQYKMGLAQVLVKGVKGQTELVIEVMKATADTKALINQDQEEERTFSMREIIEMNATALGTQSLDQCLVKLFNQGSINEDIMMFNSPDPDALIYRQNKLNVKLSTKWDPTGAEIERAMENMMGGKEKTEEAETLDMSTLGLG